jgi:glutathione S-transferase
MYYYIFSSYGMTEYSSNKIQLLIEYYFQPFDGRIFKDVRADCFNALKSLNTHLATRTFIVGDALTLADVVIVSVLAYPMRLLLDAQARKAYPHVGEYVFFSCNVQYD